MASVFETLSAVNVNGHTESKNGLTYLSWAWAWGELKKRYPEASYTVYENRDGLCYHTDGKTCWVKTGVTVEGLENIEYLPVMDYKNRAIPLENVTSMDVNKAIQRSLTKAIARHGLGLYIYAGEDLPDGEEKQKASEEDKRQLRASQITEVMASLQMDKQRFDATWRAVVDAGLVPRKKWGDMTDDEFAGFISAIVNNFTEGAA